MKGFILGFVAAVIIILGAWFIGSVAHAATLNQVLEGNEAQEDFCEFVEIVYDEIDKW